MAKPSPTAAAVPPPSAPLPPRERTQRDHPAARMIRPPDSQEPGMSEKTESGQVSAPDAEAESPQRAGADRTQTSATEEAQGAEKGAERPHRARKRGAAAGKSKPEPALDPRAAYRFRRNVESAWLATLAAETKIHERLEGLQEAVQAARAAGIDEATLAGWHYELDDLNGTPQLVDAASALPPPVRQRKKRTTEE